MKNEWIMETTLAITHHGGSTFLHLQLSMTQQFHCFAVMSHAVQYSVFLELRDHLQ